MEMEIVKLPYESTSDEITRLKPDDPKSATIFMLYQIAKSYDKDGEWKHWEGIMRQKQIDYFVSFDFLLTREMFTFKQLKIEPKSSIIIH